MKQSELSPLIITMAAEALNRAEEIKRPIDDELIKKIMGHHGPFERGSFGYHLRTVRTICKKPTRLIEARRNALKTERSRAPGWTAFDPRMAQLPPGDRD